MLHVSDLSGVLGEDAQRILAAEGDEPKEKKDDAPKDKKDEPKTDDALGLADGPAPEMPMPMMMGPKFAPGMRVRDIFSGQEGMVAEPPQGDFGDIVFVTFNSETHPIRQDQLEEVGGAGAALGMSAPLGAGPEGEPAPGSPIPGAPEVSTAPKALPNVAKARRLREANLKATMTVGEAAEKLGLDKDGTFDTALPQPWVDEFKKVTGMWAPGHFVWHYPNTGADGPRPLTAQGLEALKKFNEAKGTDYPTDLQVIAGARRFFVKAGGGAGIRFENFEVADGGSGVVGKDGIVEWKTMPTLAKFDAMGYMDGMMGVRGDLLNITALKVFTEDAPGSEFSLPSSFDISFVWQGGWTRSAPKAGDLIEPDRIHDQSDGINVEAITLQVTEDFVYFYQDVFDHYWPEDEEVKEYCEANEIPLPESEREFERLKVELSEMHDDDARINWGAGQKSQPNLRGRRIRVAKPGKANMRHGKAVRAAKGGGWGSLTKGRRITDIKELRPGMVLLEHSNQFDADNVVRITRGDDTGLGRPIAYGRFVNPENLDEPRLPGDQEFSIWDFNLRHDEFYEAQGTGSPKPTKEAMEEEMAKPLRGGLVTDSADPRRLSYPAFRARLVAGKVTTHADALAIVGYLPKNWDLIVARLAKDGVGLQSPKGDYDVQALLKKGFNAQEVRFVLASKGVPVYGIDAVLKMVADGDKPTTPPPKDPPKAGYVWAWDKEKGGWYEAEAVAPGTPPPISTAASLKAGGVQKGGDHPQAIALDWEETAEGLVFTANEAFRAELREMDYPKQEQTIAEALIEYGDLEFIAPEDIGALTDAPIVGRPERDDQGNLLGLDGDIYWFPNYAVESPWETLAATGKVVFSAAERHPEGGTDPKTFAAALRTKASTDLPEDMVEAYLATALWSSTDESTESGGEPLDKNYDTSDFSDKARAGAEADCEAFKQKAGALLEGVSADSGQVGHDFWLTRNHHGAGFWDRPELYKDKETAKALTDIAHGFGEAYVFVGDDGELNIE